MHDFYEGDLDDARVLLHALEHTAIHLGHIWIICQLWDDRWEATNP
ncbi:MAG: hypothetical protein U9R58_09660 [Chloroflexota bacterium]|nr:hypothetical protein [Chloroflexota bacterium]